jgi:hypothetical protein
MKKPVDEFDAILLASLELETAMKKANMSMLQLLQVEHNPNPVGIDSFLRMAETIRRAWSVLLRKGKAPTRQARCEVEKQQLIPRTKKKTLMVRKKRSKN